jgi:hypothetical protein
MLSCFHSVAKKCGCSEPNKQPEEQPNKQPEEQPNKQPEDDLSASWTKSVSMERFHLKLRQVALLHLLRQPDGRGESLYKRKGSIQVSFQRTLDLLLEDLTLLLL